MTTLNPPRLPFDPVLTIAAAVVAALTVGGWAFALVSPDIRSNVGAQGAIWWVQQLLVMVQAILCLGVLLQLPAAVRAAFPITLTVLALLTVQWLQGFGRGHVALPVTPVVNALLLWRIMAARRSQTAAVDAPAA